MHEKEKENQEKKWVKERNVRRGHKQILSTTSSLVTKLQAMKAVR